MKRTGHQIIKKIPYRISAVLVALTVLSGCGEAQTQDQTQEAESTDTAETTDTAESTDTAGSTETAETELLEPVGVAADYETVDYRNIFDAEVYGCMVSPAVTEYSYTTDEAFGSYGSLPGQDVVYGDVLISGDTKAIQDELEDIDEEYTEVQSDHEDTLADLYDDLYEAKKTEYDTSQIYGSLKADEPKEDSPGYSGWAAGVMPAEGTYKAAQLARERVDESILEEEELFELKEDYYNGKKERLEARQATSQIVTDTDGTVVMCGNYSKGDSILKNSAVMAVGNFETKVLYAPYTSAKALEEAADIYAFVDGKRFEVEYTPLDQDEYFRMKRRDSDVYMPFTLVDPDNELSFGEYGVLVVVNAERRDVLSIPSDAVTFEDGQYYVNRLSGDDDTEKVRVEIGLSGKLYTELLSGLEQGDRILTDKAGGASKKTAALEKGTTYTDTKDSATLFYPSVEWVTNPAETGTCYISEICVKKNEMVSRGQEVAKVEVQADTVEIDRLQRRIERQQERLKRLQEQKAKNYSDEVDTALEKSIRQKQSAIERYTRQLEKLQKYSGTISLTSPFDGVVMELTSCDEGDVIGEGENLVKIADTAQSYVVVSGESDKYSYGGTVTVSYRDGSKNEETEGSVVSVCDSALSGTLRQGLTLISLPAELTAQLAAKSSNESKNGWSQSKYTVTAETGYMENVILIPRSAVILEGGDTFVKVNTGDGRATYVQFIAGGLDTSNYWAVDGLEEGMEICLD